MISRAGGARAAASIVLAGALLLGTSGCTFITPQATQVQYDPSDGIGAQVGDVKIRNVIALLGDEGSTVSLLITMVNEGDRSANVRLQFESAGEKITLVKAIGANDAVSYGNTVDEDQIIIVDSGALAGGLYPVYVQYGDNPGVQLLVPVLPADNLEYQPLKP